MDNRRQFLQDLGLALMTSNAFALVSPAKKERQVGGLSQRGVDSTVENWMRTWMAVSARGPKGNLSYRALPIRSIFC